MGFDEFHEAFHLVQHQLSDLFGILLFPCVGLLISPDPLERWMSFFDGLLARAAALSKPDPAYFVHLRGVPDTARARDDPRGFLAQYKGSAILDDVQRVPSILSYLQQIVDESPLPGSFILTGSQQFGLGSAVSQSLAGRVGRLIEKITESLPSGATTCMNHGTSISGGTTVVPKSISSWKMVQS